jgi:hypothetical protein
LAVSCRTASFAKGKGGGDRQEAVCVNRTGGFFSVAKRGEICYTMGYYGLTLAGASGLAVLTLEVIRRSQ